MHMLYCLLGRKTCFLIPLCCYLRRNAEFAFPFLLIDWCDFHLSTTLLYLWTHSFLMDIMSCINMKMIFTGHLLVQSITTSTNMKQHGLFSFAQELATWSLCEVKGWMRRFNMCSSCTWVSSCWSRGSGRRVLLCFSEKLDFKHLLPWHFSRHCRALREVRPNSCLQGADHWVGESDTELKTS